MEFPLFYYNTIFFLVILLIVTYLVVFIGSKVKSKFLVGLFRLFRIVGIILIVFFSIILILICTWELFAYTFDVRNRYLDADYVYKALYQQIFELVFHLDYLKSLNASNQEIRLNLISDMLDALRDGDFAGYKLAIHETVMFLCEHSPKFRGSRDLIRMVDLVIDQYNYDKFSDIYYYCLFCVDESGKPLNN